MTSVTMTLQGFVEPTPGTQIVRFWPANDWSVGGRRSEVGGRNSHANLPALVWAFRPLVREDPVLLVPAVREDVLDVAVLPHERSIGDLSDAILGVLDRQTSLEVGPEVLVPAQP